MGIRFTCPNGHKLNVKPFLGGKRAVCPKCGVKMRVPLESQNATANFADPHPEGFAPQRSHGPQDSANPHNSNGIPAGGMPDFPAGLPEREYSQEDDIFLADDGSPLLDDAGPVADIALNEAAFLDDPLKDPRANAALADAALVDPALGDPAASQRGNAKAPRPPGPPPLRPTAPQPARHASAQHGSAQRAAAPPAAKAPAHKPALQPMSGRAVDQVIAGADQTLQPAMEEGESSYDPILRFRLQRQRRDRIMMMLSAGLAVVVLILLIVLFMVLPGSQEPVDETVQPAAATGTEPAAK